jgi:hypothetical protein
VVEGGKSDTRITALEMRYRWIDVWKILFHLSGNGLKGNINQARWA